MDEKNCCAEIESRHIKMRSKARLLNRENNFSTESKYQDKYSLYMSSDQDQMPLEKIYFS